MPFWKSKSGISEVPRNAKSRHDLEEKSQLSKFRLMGLLQVRLTTATYAVTKVRLCDLKICSKMGTAT
jgi:hypothetical protein